MKMSEKYTMDPTLPWEERYRQLEAHHVKETTMMLDELQEREELAKELAEELYRAIGTNWKMAPIKAYARLVELVKEVENTFDVKIMEGSAPEAVSVQEGQADVSALKQVVELSRIAERFLSIKVDWEVKYDLIFSIAKQVRELGVHIEYCDPDTTYEEDSRAYVAALTEKARQLEGIIASEW